MTENGQSERPPLAPAKTVTEFEVRDGRTLHRANYAEAETRADFYEDVASFWSGSPEDLAEAMDECEPLAWEVHRVYSECRDELEWELDEAAAAGAEHRKRVTALRARLRALPREPEDGAAAWLLGLTSNEFEDRVVPEIEKWFGEPPNWGFEDDYLPEMGTAQGAALAYFRDMAAGDLKALGVKVIEGQHPGSTYYAAELRGDIDEANRAAEAAGIPVRFVAVTD